MNIDGDTSRLLVRFLCLLILSRLNMSFDCNGSVNIDGDTSRFYWYVFMPSHSFKIGSKIYNVVLVHRIL